MKELLLSLIILCPAAAQAQGGRPPRPDSLELASEFSGRDGLDSRSAGFKYSAGLGRLAAYSMRFSAGASHLRSRGSAGFPGELYGVSAKLGAASRAWSFSAGARSDSDRPFNSKNETDLLLNASRPIGGRGPHRFIFGVNYSSRRSFLRGIPLPYVSYSYRSEKLSIFLPFRVSWRPAPGSELSASYLPPKYFLLSFSREVSASVTLGVSGGVRMSQYLLADRPDKDRSLFLEQPNVELNATLKPEGGWEAGLRAGWGFAARYFTGESYDEHHGLVRTGSGPLAGLSLKRSF